MTQSTVSQTHTETNVALVVPVWLQNALIVLLRSVPELKLIACTATVEVLLSLDLESAPDLLVLEAHTRTEQAQSQIERLKTAWPTAHFIVLVSDTGQKEMLEKLGVDEVLITGAAPQRLRDIINRLKNLTPERDTNDTNEN